MTEAAKKHSKAFSNLQREVEEFKKTLGQVTVGTYATHCKDVNQGKPGLLKKFTWASSQVRTPFVFS